MYRDVNSPADLPGETLQALWNYMLNSKNHEVSYRGKRKDVILRDPNELGIDLAIISLYIQDDINQSLRELAIRIAIDCSHDFEKTLHYLENLRYPGIGYYTSHMVNGVTMYELNPWEPGKKEPVYIAYCNWENVTRFRHSKYMRYSYIFNEPIVVPSQ